MEKRAQLIFDSWREPSPTGIRSSGIPSQHMLYQADNFVLDLRVELLSDSNRILLIGQVLHCSKPQYAVSNVPVIIMNNTENLAQTTTDELGEFYMEPEPNKGHRLAVVVNEQRIVVILTDGPPVKSSNARRGERRPLKETEEIV